MAADVEAFGGLGAVKNLSFREFAETFAGKDDERTRIYGGINTKQREKVRHRLDYWRKLGTGEYENLLKHWRITPAGYRLEPPTRRPALEPKRSKSPPIPAVVSTSGSIDTLSLSLSSLKLTNHDLDTMADHNVCKFQIVVESLLS